MCMFWILPTDLTELVSPRACAVHFVHMLFNISERYDGNNQIWSDSSELGLAAPTAPMPRGKICVGYVYALFFLWSKMNEFRETQSGNGSESFRVEMVKLNWDKKEFSLQKRIELVRLPHMSYYRVWKFSWLVGSVGTKRGIMVWLNGFNVLWVAGEFSISVESVILPFFFTMVMRIPAGIQKNSAYQ